MRRSRLGRFAASAVLVAGALTAGSATSAAASDIDTMSCGHSWGNPSAQSGKLLGDDYVNIRSGPHTTCASLGLLAPGTSLYAHCWDEGGAAPQGNIWWHVRKAGTNLQGWVNYWYLPWQLYDSAHC